MKYALFLFAFSLLLTLIINLIASKFNFLIYKPDMNHKENFKNKIFNTGGCIFLFYYLSIQFLQFQINEFYNLLFFILIFSIGLFSDIKNINANFRLIIISLFSIIYVVYTKSFIIDLKFDILNNLFLNYEIIAILFTSVCIVILINGINFIDGVHGMVLLYSIIVLSLLNYFIFFILSLNTLPESGLILIPIISVLLIFNLKEKIFFGDAGSYLIGAILGVLIIKITNTHGYSYPYFYANLLIYPAFEVFFSIFRKMFQKKGPYQADKKHLHHLIQNFYLKKNFNLTNSKILSSISINFIIFFFNLISINFYQNKYILIPNIFAFVIFYLISYFYFNKKTKNYY